MIRFLFFIFSIKGDHPVFSLLAIKSTLGSPAQVFAVKFFSLTDIVNTLHLFLWVMPGFW